ncbi:MAG: ABC transporter substrate-binding protein [Pseudomonadota bacterium]
MLCASLMLLGFSILTNARADSDALDIDAARDKAEQVSAQFFALADQNRDADEYYAAIHALVRDNFDLATITRFILGPYGRTISKPQIEEFQSTVLEYIVYSYGGKIRNYRINQFSITGLHPGKRGTVRISVRIMRDQDDPLDVDWRLRKLNGEWKIFDISFAGLSMAITQREEFTSYIAQHNGDVAALIKRLRAQIDQTRNSNLSAQKG